MVDTVAVVEERIRAWVHKVPVDRVAAAAGEVVVAEEEPFGVAVVALRVVEAVVACTCPREDCEEVGDMQLVVADPYTARVDEDILPLGWALLVASA